MGKVILDLSMSLDGFIVGPAGYPERLHDWMFPASGEVAPASSEMMAEQKATFGAIIMGRKSYDEGDRNDGYVEDAYGVLNVVITHQPPAKPAKGNTRFVFVTDGIESALKQAKAAAGDKDIAIGGGAEIAQQYLSAGLVDEIGIHIVPVLFGSGLRLFDHLASIPVELEASRVIAAPGVTHIFYRVVR